MLSTVLLRLHRRSSPWFTASRFVALAAVRGAAADTETCIKQHVPSGSTCSLHTCCSSPDPAAQPQTPHLVLLLTDSLFMVSPTKNWVTFNCLLPSLAPDSVKIRTVGGNVWSKNYITFWGQQMSQKSSSSSSSTTLFVYSTTSSFCYRNNATEAWFVINI